MKVKSKTVHPQAHITGIEKQVKSMSTQQERWEWHENYIKRFEKVELIQTAENLSTLVIQEQNCWSKNIFFYCILLKKPLTLKKTHFVWILCKPTP